jgi:hypothetical protein
LFIKILCVILQIILMLILERIKMNIKTKAATFHLEIELLEKLRKEAFVKRIPQAKIYNQVLRDYFSKEKQ